MWIKNYTYSVPEVNHNLEASSKIIQGVNAFCYHNHIHLVKQLHPEIVFLNANQTNKPLIMDHKQLSFFLFD